MAEFHQRELTKSCRVCGCNTGKLHKYKYQTLTPHVAEKLKSAYGLVFAEDDPKIHPQNVCVLCYTKSLKACKNQNFNCSTPLVTWTSHQEIDCEVCNSFRRRNQGGRKPRQRKGRGRPAEALKKDENKTHSPINAVVHIPSEIVPAILINPMPNIERFEKISKELVCPVCREVLDRPLQAACEHFFCYSCIEKWLSYNSNGAGCPVCKQIIKSEELRKPPRLLLNLLSTSYVKCTVCKAFMKLEELAKHESTCTSYVKERPTTLVTDILKTPTATPLSREEETLTTHLMKRKLNNSDSPNVLLQTGGTVSIIEK